MENRKTKLKVYLNPRARLQGGDAHYIGNAGEFAIEEGHEVLGGGLVIADLCVMRNGLWIGATERFPQERDHVGRVVLRDRQLLAQDGIAMIVVTVDVHNGRVVGEPELVTRGIVFGAASDGFMDDAKARIAKTLAKTAKEGATDQAVIKNAVRESLSQLMWERIRRRPMIIPVVMEV